MSCLGTRRGSYSSTGFDTRDLECALMYNSNDAIFSLRTGFTAPYSYKRETGAHWYQIKGTEMTTEWARSTEDLPKSFTQAGGWEMHPEWRCCDANAPQEFKKALHGGADYYPMYYFMDAILNDKTPPMDVYKAVETASPAILAKESAQQSGLRIEVPDFRQ